MPDNNYDTDSETEDNSEPYSISNLSNNSSNDKLIYRADTHIILKMVLCVSHFIFIIFTT